MERRYRWIAFLEEMRCVITYIPGKDNIISDFISRNGINEEALQILSVILDSVKFNNDKLLAEQMNDPQIAAVLTYLTSRKEVQPTEALSQEYRQCTQIMHYRRTIDLRSPLESLCRCSQVAEKRNISYVAHRMECRKFWLV